MSMSCTRYKPEAFPSQTRVRVVFAGKEKLLLGLLLLSQLWNGVSALVLELPRIPTGVSKCRLRPICNS